MESINALLIRNGLEQGERLIQLNSVAKTQMKSLIDNLFCCQVPGFSPSGKNIIQIMNMDEIEKRF